MAAKTKKDYGPLDAIQGAMGVMGPWQIIIAVALSFINFPAAWNQMSNVILTPDTNFTCINAGPVTNSSPFSDHECYYTVKVPPKDNSSTISVNRTEKCTKFEYDRTYFQNSVITEWDLVCDQKYLVNFIQSGTMLCVLIGNMLFGFMADRIGRKIPLMIAVVVQSVAGLLCSLSPWFAMFVICKFIGAVATGGTMLTSFVILMEIVGIEWRSTLSVLFHITTPMGHFLIAVFGYYTPGWKEYSLAISIPPMILLSYYWLIPESPRWLLATKKEKRAEKVLEAAAKRNGISQDKVIAAIESHATQSGKEVETDLESSKTYNLIDLFRTPRLRIRTICIAFNWLVCGNCYFGVAQFVGKLEGSPFLNIGVAAISGLPGILIVLFLISRFSRLRILMGSNVTAGLSLLLLMFIEDPTARVALATIGLTAMSMSFPTIYLYTGEVFPTVVRNIGFGLCSVLTRAGSMIAPYIVDLSNYGKVLPPLLFGIGPLVGAGLCFFLPETRDCKLPETIEEAENFRKGKTDVALEAAD